MRNPTVIYYVDRDGQRSAIHRLHKSDETDYDDPELTYTHGIKYLDDHYAYFTKKKEAVKVMRSYLRDQILILKSMLKNTK